MKHLATLLVFVSSLSACVSGPRPMPANATSQERLQQMEQVLLSLKKAQATLVVEASGAHTAKLTGSLQILGSNQVYLTADGAYDKDMGVHVEADSRTGPLVRTLSKASTASSHQDPPTDAIGEVVALSLARSGLMKTLSVMIADEPIPHATGGFDGAVKALNVNDGGNDTASGQTCRRLNFDLSINGAVVGPSSVCVSETTSLPLLRNTTMNVNGAAMTVTERYTWVL